MQLIHDTTPTSTIPTCLTDDFGNEMFVIPGEHCRLSEKFFEMRVIAYHTWDALIKAGCREYE